MAYQHNRHESKINLKKAESWRKASEIENIEGRNRQWLSCRQWRRKWRNGVENIANVRRQPAKSGNNNMASSENIENSSMA
jgi:hypothetical protein